MFHEIKVKQIEHITAQSAVVEFDIPQTLQTEFNFFAGQYLTLEALLEGEAVRRSYSLCSAPYENSWKVGIKKIPGGRFSSYAKEQLKVLLERGKGDSSLRDSLQAVNNSGAFAGITKQTEFTTSSCTLRTKK